MKDFGQAASGKMRGQTLPQGITPAPRGKRKPSPCLRLETVPCFQSGGLGSLPRPRVVVTGSQEVRGFSDSCPA